METKITQGITNEGELTGQATNKIDVNKNSKYNFILLDNLTDSIIGVYSSNQKATNTALELVKQDLSLLINYYRTQILLGFEADTKNENKDLLAQLKQYLYQYKNIKLSNQLHITMGDKNVLRYIIRMVKTNEDDSSIDESCFNLI
jgi:organic radical activating enzyme